MESSSAMDIWVASIACGLIVLILISIVLTHTRKMRRFKEEGVPASAKILSLHETGSSVNDQPVLRIELEILRDDQETPYIISVTDSIPVTAHQFAQTGKSLRLLVLPDEPYKIEIAWGAKPDEGRDSLWARIDGGTTPAARPLPEPVALDPNDPVKASGKIDLHLPPVIAALRLGKRSEAVRLIRDAYHVSLIVAARHADAWIAANPALDP